MIQRILILSGLLLFFGTTNLVAQTAETDFFADKWEVTITGTPAGDHTFVMNITREGDGLKGVFLGEDGSEVLIDRVQAGDDSLTIEWFAEGHHVSMRLAKQDENNLSGSLLGMFDSTAERILE
jgi:hypothetical protein